MDKLEPKCSLGDSCVNKRAEQARELIIVVATLDYDEFPLCLKNQRHGKQGRNFRHNGSQSAM